MIETNNNDFEAFKSKIVTTLNELSDNEKYDDELRLSLANGFLLSVLKINPDDIIVHDFYSSDDND